MGEKITIIIPCYSLERLDDLKALLDSIACQTYPDIEALVVAERSRELADDIRNYVREKKYPGIEVLFNEGERGVSASRNLGIERATGDIIAFVDDDAVLDNDWAGATANTYRADDSVIGATGPIAPLWEDDSLAWFPPVFYWVFSCTAGDSVEKKEVRNGYGTNISFRREAFRAVPLFRTTMGVRGRGQKGWQEPGAEETDFSIKVRAQTGRRIIYDPGIKVQHRVYRYRTKAGFIIKRAYWEGYAKAMLKHMHSQGSTRNPVLSREYGLLKDILFSFIPRTIVRLFSRPVISLRRLWVTTLILSCVAAGYAKFSLTRLVKQDAHQR